MQRNNTKILYTLIFCWILVHLIFFQTFIFHDSWKHMFPLYYSFVNQGACLDIPSWLGTIDNGSPMLIYLISTSLTQITQIPYFFIMECLKPGVISSIYAFKFQIYLTYLIFSMSLYILGRNIYSNRSSAIFLFTACLFSGMGLDHAHSNQIVSIIFWYPWIIISAILFTKSENIRQKFIWSSFLSIFISAQTLDQYPHFVVTILFLATITFIVPYLYKNKMRIDWADTLKLFIPVIIVLGITTFELLTIKETIEGYQPSLRSGLVITPKQFSETGFLQPTAFLASFLPLSFMFEFDNLRNGGFGFIFKLDALLMICGTFIILFATFFIYCVKTSEDKRIRNSLVVFIVFVTLIAIQQTKLYFIIFEIPFFNLFRSYFLFTPFIILSVIVLAGYGFDRFQSSDFEVRRLAAKKTCVTVVSFVFLALICFIFLYLKSHNFKIYLITIFLLMLDLSMIFISIYSFYKVSRKISVVVGLQKMIVLNCIFLIVLISVLYQITGISTVELLKKYQINSNLSASSSKIFSGNEREMCNSFVECYVNANPTVSSSLDLNGTFLRNKNEPIFFISEIGGSAWKLFSGLDGKSAWIAANVDSTKEISEMFLSDFADLQLEKLIFPQDKIFDKFPETKVAKLEIKEWRGGFIRLNYYATTPSVIYLALNYDLAWKAKRSSDLLSLETSPANIGGTSIVVPSGSGDIVLEYKNFASIAVFFLRYLTVFLGLIGIIFIYAKTFRRSM